MKTKICGDYFEELASYVAEGDSLNEEAAAHLRRCAGCQQKVAELKRVAVNCREAALHIPEPRRRLCRAELVRSLKGEGRQWRAPWWPAFVGCASIVVAIVIFVARNSPEPIDLTGRAKPLPEAGLKESVITPTMLALRHDLQGGLEQILALSNTRNGMNHYRVGDVERELQ